MPRGVEDPGRSFASWVARWNNGSVCTSALKQIRRSNTPQTIRYDSTIVVRNTDPPFPASARLRTQPRVTPSATHISPPANTLSCHRTPAPAFPPIQSAFPAPLSPAAHHLVTTHPTHYQQRGPHPAVMRSLALCLPIAVCTFPRRAVGGTQGPVPVSKPWFQHIPAPIPVPSHQVPATRIDNQSPGGGPAGAEGRGDPCPMSMPMSMTPCPIKSTPPCPSCQCCVAS